MAIDGHSYRHWIERYDTLDAPELDAARRFMSCLERRPRFDVLLPVYNPPEAFLAEAIASVRAQIYPEWTLCIHDDCSTKPYVGRILDDAVRSDSRIRVGRGAVNQGIASATNAALALGSSEFVTFLDHDDVLPPQALLLFSHYISRSPEVQVAHGDLDLLDGEGTRTNPYFKPGFDHELLLASSITWGVFRRALVERLGGMQTRFPGAEDSDLSLRAMELAPPGALLHIPHIVYHWRMVPTSFAHAQTATWLDSAHCAALAHCDRMGIACESVMGSAGGMRVRAIPRPLPTVTIVAEGCGDASVDLAARYAAETDYPLLRVHDASGERSTAASRNAAAHATSTDLVVFANHRLSPRSPDWLREMVSHMAFASCAAVGARIVGPQGHVQQSGVLLGVREQPGSFPAARAMHGAREDDPGYYGRARMAHCSGALAGGILLVRRSNFLDLGGFDEAFPELCAAELDLSLRARALGKTLVTCPLAIFDAPAPEPWFADEASVYLLKERWGATLEVDPYHNPNLSNLGSGFELAFPPRVQFPWRC